MKAVSLAPTRGSPPELSARRIAYDHLRNAILSGALEGGSHIGSEEVATSLGISRMPVREALGQLHVEGLVTLRPNRGAVVNIPSPDQALELFEMRAVLEGWAASLVRERLTSEHLRELELLNLRMEGLRADPKAWIWRHVEFHTFLAATAGRPRLANQIELLHAALQPTLTLYLSAVQLSRLEPDAHLRLVHEIRDSRRGSVAEKLARDHVMESAAGVLDFLQQRQAGALR